MERSDSLWHFLLYTLQLQSFSNLFDLHPPFLPLPENSDIKVGCGTEYMDLSIYVCPVYNSLYNESLMVLNNQVSNPECYGTVNWTAVPPRLEFRFPINGSHDSSFCSNTYKVSFAIFSDFSLVQYINISGTIVSIDPTAGVITYQRPILYRFSCKYPMQYLLNNTEVAVSGASLAIRDNNGSFISTLYMKLYHDPERLEPLLIPETGLSLKTRIYVGVHAKNLTEKFHVLLDRCFATTSPYPVHDTHYDLFVGCTVDAQTKVEVNGQGQQAYFSFEAFRFVEHKNLTISTFYLHCVTRLCDATKCSSLLPVSELDLSDLGRRQGTPWTESYIKLGYLHHEDKRTEES
uniref:Si:dkey-4p15.5 n=1 Tax=Stegastes partitus TaxID=144197 RepID=A0A3B5AGD8_9TELE